MKLTTKSNNIILISYILSRCNLVRYYVNFVALKIKLAISVELSYDLLDVVHI